MGRPANVYVASLLKLGLITHEAHEQALTGAVRDELEAADSEESALFTLIGRGVVTEDELDGRIRSLEVSAGTGLVDDARRLEILTTTRADILEVIANFHRKHMNVLATLGLIDAVQLEAGCRVRPERGEGHIDTPAKALAILVGREIVTNEQFDQLKAASRDDAPQQTERDAVVLEAARLHHEIVGKYVKAMSSGILRMTAFVLVAVFSFVGVLFVLFRWLSRSE